MEQLRNHVDVLEHQIHTAHQPTDALTRQPRCGRGLASRLSALGLRRGRTSSRVQMTPCSARLLSILAMGMVIGWITSAAGQSISCGDTLGPGGVFQLQEDMECVDVSPALTLRDGARLDLGGHTLTLLLGHGPTVLLEGQGATLQNGTVRCEGCGHLILVAGRGKHTVRHVNAGAENLFGQAVGITVISDANQLLSNMGSGYYFGFLIQGNKNQLDSNHGVGQAGLVVDGHQNLLVNNSCPIMHIGFMINGNKNALMDNDASWNGEGIVVYGEGNRIMRNTTLGNLVDLFDAHENCDGNRWRQNIFETSQAGVTANPACIQ